MFGGGGILRTLLMRSAVSTCGGAFVGGGIGYLGSGGSGRAAAVGAFGGAVGGLTLGLAGPTISNFFGNEMLGGAMVGGVSNATGDLAAQYLSIRLGMQNSIIPSQTGIVFAGGFMLGGLTLRVGTLPNQQVTHWGPPSPWVQIGGLNRLNYFLSGAAENYSFNSGVSSTVLGSMLRWPSGWEFIKGIIGQRIYTGSMV